MKVISTCCAIGFSLLLCVAVQAKSATPLGVEAARHLLVRTGFNAPPDEIKAFAELDASHAVARILNQASTEAKTPLPDWVSQAIEREGKLSAQERKERNRVYREQGQDLRAWWYQEMLTTASPMTERMTLFWHNHFTSSLSKVKVPQLMAEQNQLLRRYALGNYGELLDKMAKNPAMLVYLDGAKNVVGKPNENFAREVMELFSLGEGNYTEQDIREAARAFTGWSVDRNTGEFVNRSKLHDAGEKTIFGQTGRFDGDDVIRLILARPQTSEYIVGRLWREFVSPELDHAEVARLAKQFRKHNYEIKPLLQAMLMSEAFYAPQNRARLVKSPVELIVGTAREFSLAPTNWKPFMVAAKQMEQDIFDPPNVKGWPGAEWWINSKTLSVRQLFMSRIVRGDGRGKRTLLEPDYDAWMKVCNDDAGCAALSLLADPPPVLPQGRSVDVIRALTADPRYQLK